MVEDDLEMVEVLNGHIFDFLLISVIVMFFYKVKENIMNNNLKEYIESFDNIIWLYRNIIDNKILENESVKNIDNETKKELFDYIFDKYLDSESELNSLSIDARYYGGFFCFLKEYKNILIHRRILH